MNGAIVRPIEEDDIPRVWELLRELAEYERLTHVVIGTPERLAHLLFGEEGPFEGLVVERDERIVGYALFYTTGSSFRTATRLWLEDLYVEQAERGTGAGIALMRELARVALERGCDRVQWDVLDWNEPAINFYRRLGAAPAPPQGWTTFGVEGDALKALAGVSEPSAPRPH